jgi:hypothetical protein
VWQATIEPEHRCEDLIFDSLECDCISSDFEHRKRLQGNRLDLATDVGWSTLGIVIRVSVSEEDPMSYLTTVRLRSMAKWLLLSLTLWLVGCGKSQYDERFEASLQRLRANPGAVADDQAGDSGGQDSGSNQDSSADDGSSDGGADSADDGDADSDATGETADNFAETTEDASGAAVGDTEAAEGDTETAEGDTETAEGADAAAGADEDPFADQNEVQDSDE